ncbi:spoIIIJ-associated protein [Sinobaca qinghaiensis]|uniref:RNA-binding protein KhpB n=1 Tax=Sinobaca qinghaiensis TaxID=342944 RepID=A0A419UUD2_9BACL|nr:RNA-binding cell elongation regulator Jag/EloR [Sinobaca qinghaiensis]RKD68088.1 spoIIIJ-associated protein [Sinobaca qinghaiensis]
MKTVTVSGKTIEEAKANALLELSIEEDQLEYELVQVPVKGFLGLFKGKPAIIEAKVKQDPTKEAAAFLTQVLKEMGTKAEIEITEKKKEVLFDIQGEDLGVLIGKRGKTLDSLEYLVNLAANRYSDKYSHITLDAENYRERRREALQQLAARLADKARKTKRKVVLEPMSSRERKIIHAALQNEKDIETASEGKEPHRYVAIFLSKK